MHRTLGSAVLAFALVSGSTALAHDRDDVRRGPAIFVTIAGIDGESTQRGHEGEIEAFNFSETFRQSASLATGVGGGKFTPGPVVFSKVQGKASIKLYDLCVKGTHLPEVTIEVWRQAGDGKTVKSFVITLKNVLVSAINEQSSGDSLTDEVQLVFESARWEMFNPPAATEWDGATNKAPSIAPTTGRNTR
jgi:type VI secretion system Hcp family effector